MIINKKLIFTLLPLFALVSCGGGGGGDTPAKKTYTVTFDTNGGSLVASQTVEEGKKATRPAQEPTKTDYIFDDWYTTSSYSTKFNFDSAINSNTTIYAKWNTPKWYQYKDWWNHTSEATSSDIGLECNLKVNNIDHKVRLIGIDEDVDKDGNTCHTTWEFSNFICDSDGYSLAALWNDYSNQYQSNIDYTSSTIRANLCGSGGATIRWYEKENGSYSSKTSSVYNMISDTGIKSLMKSAKKKVGVLKTSTPSYTWEEKEYNDKLFLLTTLEMGYSLPAHAIETHTAYSYYSSCTTVKDSKRIKKQINSNTASYVSITQSARSTGTNYAGSTQRYYLASPYTNGSSDLNHEAWEVDYQGNIGPSYYSEVTSNAYPIAPAFCI